MKVTVKYAAQVRQAAGVSNETVDSNDTTMPLGSVLKEIVQRHDEKFVNLIMKDGKLRPSILVTINDEQVEPNPEFKISDGDIVTILSPMSGG